MEAIIVAIITGAFAVIGNLIIARSTTKQKKADDAVQQALLEVKLSSIEKKLDEHNHYASRFNEIEKAIVEIQTDIRNLKELKNG